MGNRPGLVICIWRLLAKYSQKTNTNKNKKTMMLIRCSNIVTWTFTNLTFQIPFKNTTAFSLKINYTHLCPLISNIVLETLDPRNMYEISQIITSGRLQPREGGALPKNMWRVCAATLTPIFKPPVTEWPPFYFSHFALT